MPHIVEKINTGMRFFIYVLIFWTPYSPAAVEICVGACLVLWLSKRTLLFCDGVSREIGGLSRARYFFRSFAPVVTRINRTIGVFLVICLLSVTQSLWPQQSLISFFKKTLEWFLIYWFVVEVFTEKKHFYTAAGVFICTAAATILDGIVQYYVLGRDIFFGRTVLHGVPRATAAFKAPSGLGAYLTIVVPAALGFCAVGKRNIWRRGGVCLFLMGSIWVLVLTFSRGAWFASVCGVLIFIVIFVRHQRVRRRYVVLLAGMIVSVFFAVGYITVKEAAFPVAHEVRGTARWRLGVWEDTVNMIKEKPLLGHGINTYMRLFQSYRRKAAGLYQYQPTYAHNCYLQITAETGIIGGGVFMLMLYQLVVVPFFAWQRFIPADRDMRLLWMGLLSGIVAFLIHSAVDTNFYSVQLSVYVWTMAGWYMAIEQWAVKQRDILERTF